MTKEQRRALGRTRGVKLSMADAGLYATRQAALADMQNAAPGPDKDAKAALFRAASDACKDDIIAKIDSGAIVLPSY